MSLSIQTNNACFKPTAPSARVQISEVDKKVKNLIKNKDLSDSLTGRLISSRNQLKRKVNLLPQNCPAGAIKVAPFQLGSLVVDQAKRVGAVVFPATRSLCLGILAGCVLRVFIQAVEYYCLFGNLHSFSPSYANIAKIEWSGMFNYKNLYMVVGVPLKEEIIFRGIIQRGVSRITKSPLAGIVVSAGLFGAAHLGSRYKPVCNLSILTGFGGLVFGILNHRLGLAAPFGAHAAYNFGYVCNVAYHSRRWWQGIIFK